MSHQSPLPLPSDSSLRHRVSDDRGYISAIEVFLLLCAFALMASGFYAMQKAAEESVAGYVEVALDCVAEAESRVKSTLPSDSADTLMAERVKPLASAGTKPESYHYDHGGYRDSDEFCRELESVVDAGIVRYQAEEQEALDS